MIPALTAAEIDQRWDYGDPAGSEARFRALLAERAPDSPDYPELLTQLARAQGLQRRFDAAHATLDQAESLGGALTPRARARLLLERGRAWRSAGDAQRALPLFAQALELGAAPGDDFYAIDAAHMLAIAAAPEEQAAWGLRAIAMAEASADPRARRWLAPLHNNLGWSRFDAGAYAEALAHFEQAARWYAYREQPEEQRIARWCAARTLRALGRPSEALPTLAAMRDQLAAEGRADGYVLEELAECTLLTQGPGPARPLFAAAHAALAADAGLAAREPGRLARLAELGR